MPRTPKILLTGNDPWNGERVNPSWEVVRALNDKKIAGHRIITAELPTAFKKSLNILRRLLTEHKPALVICVGQNATRSVLCLERVAINLIDAPIPDNDGDRPVDRPVVAGAPVAYFSTLPLKAMEKSLKKARIPAEISHSAGTFVCNSLFYGLMHELATRKELRQTHGGFIHVPSLRRRARKSTSPSMSFEKMVRGLHLVIKTALKKKARK